MKVIAQLFLAAAILITPAAHAYTMPEHVIAESTSSGGFAPFALPVETGVRIYDVGRVEQFEIYRDGHQTSHALASLTADRIKAILNNVKDMADVNLKKEDPTAPMCTDAPGTDYLALNGEGKVVALEGTAGCLRLVREDGKQTVVPQVLKGLEVLTWL